ncbi:MAG: TfoX/Sxy family protein [Gammaproteobacteria bacterium]
MPVSDQCRDYVLEQLRCAGQVTARKMFGGVGLYLKGMFFALIASDTLYFNRPDYEAAGMGPFQPFADRPGYTMQYYEVPVDVLEDIAELRVWANKALSVALCKASGGKKSSKKTKS